MARNFAAPDTSIHFVQFSLSMDAEIELDVFCGNVEGYEGRLLLPLEKGIATVSTLMSVLPCPSVYKAVD